MPLPILVLIFFGPAVYFLATFPLPVAVVLSVVCALFTHRLLTRVLGPWH